MQHRKQWRASERSPAPRLDARPDTQADYSPGLTYLKTFYILHASMLYSITVVGFSSQLDLICDEHSNTFHDLLTAGHSLSII